MPAGCDCAIENAIRFMLDLIYLRIGYAPQRFNNNNNSNIVMFIKLLVTLIINKALYYYRGKRLRIESFECHFSNVRECVRSF